jgi:hypothetical protein
VPLVWTLPVLNAFPGWFWKTCGCTLVPAAFVGVVATLTQ